MLAVKNIQRRPMTKASSSAILWQPTQPEATQMHAFMQQAGHNNYADLHAWSVEQPAAFWRRLWEFCGVVGSPGETTMLDSELMESTAFFPDATLNFAENLLRRRDDTDALVFRLEDQPTARLSYAQLYDKVARLSHWLRSVDVKPGDVVAGYVANCPEAIIAMLATAAVGGIWTSTSPDFGSDSVLERFSQTAPKILFAVNGYRYAGKPQPMREKLEAVLVGLPSVQHCVRIDLIDVEADEPEFAEIGRGFTDLLVTQPDRKITYEPMRFSDPLFILYSSGTTGKPKCIVHGVGGTLLQHLKEHQLHSDIRRDDRVFYFTTCGWMMWNWLASVLASEATALLYDGSPFHPDWRSLWQFAEEERCTLFGTSAKYIDALNKAGARPGDDFDLSSLRTLCSTGSVLAPESFDYVYDAIKKDLCLASISGGTDIISCFILGNPLLPVRRGECQCAGLGMDVQVFNDDGQALKNERGELVCCNAFPSQPLGFWNDEDGQRYHDAYYARFENTWHHGDFVRQNDGGGFTVFGRSDATLNPGGVRIGTAEIYRHVEQLDEVLESIAIGQDWDNDVRVVLFVVLRSDEPLDDALIKKIRETVREKCTPRHVPAKVLQVSEIPRTRSGKITELAVREVVHSREVQNKSALANPEALEQFKNRKELER